MNRHSASRNLPASARRPRKAGTAAKSPPAEPSKRPGPARDPDKRERILEAAIRVFAHKGFHGAKVAEIAQDASVADGTIYLYFKNKDDLLISLFEERMESLLHGLRGALQDVESGPDKLRACIDHLLGFAQTHPQLMEVFTVEIRQSTKFIKEYSNPKFREYLDLVAHIISEGQSQGLFRADVSPHVTARALYGSMDEICLHHVLTPRSDQAFTEAARQVREIFVQGLAPVSVRASARAVR